MDAEESGHYDAKGFKTKFHFSTGMRHRWLLELNRESRLQGVQEDFGSGSRFRVPYYPCYVMSIRNLRSLERIPFHEQALKQGLLERIDDLSVTRDSCIFVSQKWEDPDYEHPEEGKNGPFANLSISVTQCIFSISPQ